MPILILVGIIAGEIHRAIIRFRCRGTPPIERRNFSISLMRPFTSTDLIVARYEVRCSNWQGQKLRIAHISDLHVSHQYPARYYEDIMEHINETNPDLLFITGDFVTEEVDSIPLLPDILTPLSAPYKTFAVLGNHDYWAGADEIATIVQSCGVDLLRNGCRDVPHPSRLRSVDTNEHHSPSDHCLPGRGRGGLSSETHDVQRGRNICICGYEYPWGSDGLQIPSAASDGLVLVLTHTPDNIYRLSGAGADVVFAGHYHAGQFRIPYFGSVVVPSTYGRRFDHGHFIVNGTHLFATSGIGAAVLPFRIYCQPDIFIVDVMETAE
jgi:predicted MPP superfamily phosphohydrolase